MPATREDDADRAARAAELLRQLRHEADTSKEERRVVSESMAQQSAQMKRDGASAKRRTATRKAETRKRTRRTPGAKEP